MNGTNNFDQSLSTRVLHSKIPDLLIDHLNYEVKSKILYLRSFNLDFVSEK